MLAVGAVVWRWVVVQNPASPYGFQQLLGFVPLSNKLLLASFDLFAAGMALAVLSAHGKLDSVRRLNPTWAWAVAIGGFVGLSWLMAVNGPLGSHWQIQEVIGGGLRVPIAVLVVVPGVLSRQGSQRSFVSRVLGSRWLNGVGVISYGVYLWHAPVLAWVYGWAGQLAGIAIYTWILLAGTALAFTLMVALLSWRLLEKPLIVFVHGRTKTKTRERSAEPALPVG
jgi:peptidoglycan/LPS O-acetylase OafA/YrhL